MLKRLFFLFLVLAVILTGTAAADEQVIEIYDIAGLRDAANHPGASFRLMNDIDLKDVDWTPIPFSGDLDGNGFGIYNLTVTRVGEDRRITVDGNRKEYDTCFAGLFSVMEASSVKNLKGKPTALPLFWPDMPSTAPLIT